MLMTPTPAVDGMHITRCCGVIAGEAILGANLFKDLYAGNRDIAMAELRDRALQFGANAVVGIDIDAEVLGQGHGMPMVSASGTAVVHG